MISVFIWQGRFSDYSNYNIFKERKSTCITLLWFVHVIEGKVLVVRNWGRGFINRVI